LRTLVAVDYDFPSIRSLVINGGGDPRLELDIAAQVKPVRYIIQITLVLRLTRKVLLPIPFLQEFFRERKAVGFALGIKAAARIAVPIPVPPTPSPSS